MGLFNWYKHSRIIHKAEDVFEYAYNNEAPDKSINELLILVEAILFEEALNEKIKINDFKNLIRKVPESSILMKYIMMVPIDSYQIIYKFYVETRVMDQLSPIESIKKAIQFHDAYILEFEDKLLEEGIKIENTDININNINLPQKKKIYASAKNEHQTEDDLSKNFDVRLQESAARVKKNIIRINNFISIKQNIGKKRKI